MAALLPNWAEHQGGAVLIVCGVHPHTSCDGLLRSRNGVIRSDNTMSLFSFLFLFVGYQSERTLNVGTLWLESFACDAESFSVLCLLIYYV